MADEIAINGEFSDERNVEITGDEASLKISGLNQQISDLEQENRTVIRENKELKLRIEEWKSSIEDLSAENVELKTQVNNAGSENQVLRVVAARAAELETEVSRLRHDLESAKSDLEGMRRREKEKDVELESAEREKAALVGEVEKMVGFQRGLRVELEAEEKEIEDLKMNVKELEMVMGNSKSVETLKDELKKKTVNMKVEISSLESSLNEKEKVMNGFEIKERAMLDAINGDGVVEGGRKGRDWLNVGGVSAIAVIGVACYILSARKH